MESMPAYIYRSMYAHRFYLFIVGRFEKLDITPKSAQRIKPVLERWLAELEGRRVGETPVLPHSSTSTSGLGDGNSICGSIHSNPEDNACGGFGGAIDGSSGGVCRMDFESDESCAGIRKRKSRTNFSADALDRLNHEFSINMHPSGKSYLFKTGGAKKGYFTSTWQF